MDGAMRGARADWRTYLNPAETAEVAEIDARIKSIDDERQQLAMRRRRLSDRAISRRREAER